MKVLVVCITYGRLPFLGRTVASFLNQEYDNKELLIINDDKNVQLSCKHNNWDGDKISIINLNKRLSLGSKRNLGVSFGDYDIYMPHDDDDVFLPNRISNHVSKHLEHTGINLYRNEASYILYGDQFSMGANSPNAVSYTKKGWMDAGGYPDVYAWEDQALYDKMPNKLIENNPDAADYVYNWGGINYHVSCSSAEDVANIADRQLHDMGLYGSTYEIIPDWNEYDKFTHLDRLYKQSNTPMLVKHTSLGKIDVSHLESNV
jgi:glycosyltransferase involved in cell wall biosynthesis